MNTEYLVSLSHGWFWERYWLTFNESSITLSDHKKKNCIEISYKDISHVFKQPLSFDQVVIYCIDDILKSYPQEKTAWFRPRPVFTKKVFMFSIHSFKRGEIIKSFQQHGIAITITPLAFKKYWEDIVKKQYAG